MKILAIRIKNLASLEGQSEIDFTQEPLKSAGIFAITGPTGAGKSTILDAICLALYAKTPRLVNVKDAEKILEDKSGIKITTNDIKSILRDGAADGFAEVDFVAVDDQHYRARWSIKRAHGKADGRLQSDEVLLTNLNTKQPFNGSKSERQTEIERLVGLNYVQFTRSVMLAQGEFTAFLKASNDEKSALLEKLTGTQIYSEISIKVQQKHSEAKEVLKNLLGQKGGIVILSEEQINNCKEELFDLDASILNLDTKLIGLNKEMDWHKQLSELESTLEITLNEQKNALEQKEAAINREITLNKVEQVQRCREWQKAFKDANQELIKNTTELAVLDLKIKNTLSEKDIIETELNNAKIILQQKDDLFKASVSLFDEAKKLDTQLTEKALQHQKAKSELAELELELEREKTLASTKQSELESLNKTIENIDNWLTTNESRKLIAENKKTIVLKLTQADKDLAQLIQIQKLIEACEKEISSSQEAKNIFEKELEEKNNEFKELQTKFNTINQIILAIDIDNLEKELLSSIEQESDIIRAQTLWNVLYATKSQLADLNNKLEMQIKLHTELEKELPLIEQQLQEAKSSRDKLEITLQKARLVVSVDSLRANLHADEDCPVCGSKEHPFATHNPYENAVLNLLESESKESVDNYERILGKSGKLKNDIISAVKQIDEYRNQISDKEIEVQKNNKNWKETTIHSESESISEDLRIAWLEEKLNLTKSNRADLQLQISDYKNKKNTADGINTDLVKLSQEIDLLSNKIKDEERDIHVSNQSIASNLGNKTLAEKALADTEKELFTYFNNTEWFANWKNNSELFLASIEKFSIEWEINDKKLNETKQEKEKLGLLIDQLQQQLVKYNNDLNNKQLLSAEKSKELEQLIISRNAIFNGEDIKIVENRLSSDLETAKVQSEEKSSKLNEIEQQFIQIKTQKTATENTITYFNNTRIENKNQLENWLKAYNEQQNSAMNSEELDTLLNYSHEWIEKERSELKALNDKLSSINTLFEERSTKLKEHKAKALSQRAFFELVPLIETLTNDKKLLENRKQENNYLIRTQEENLIKLGSLLIEIEKQEKVEDNWHKLYNIIGSSDGKKFREIAQQYTLDVLLGYANTHLYTLSKRFRIQRIKDSLGLQVVDLDMGDDIRTVYSLSGGESFLVSLSLALGLSSLSSSRVKVESLFIDEGFGSLDLVTLNIVMDSLERLHNMGRKVCVISHVQEMTERIPTQIKVNKLSNGKSTVELIG